MRSDGAREEITDLVRWLGSDRDIASVSETGMVDWRAPGTLHVSVVFYDLRATVALTAAAAVAAR